MRYVVFAAPFALESTLRFLDAAASLPGVRLGLVSQEPIERFPKAIRRKVAAHEHVADALDPLALGHAVQLLGRTFGARIDRLLGILEPLQEPLAKVREELGIPGMGVEAARNFRDKARMKDVLRSAGLPCAKHALAGTLDEALAAADSIGFPIVVKPPDGAGAKNTCRVEGRAELESYLKALPPKPQAPVLLEEFVRGEEHSFDSVAVGGEHRFHSITRYFPTPLEVMETPWIQWCVLLEREIDGPEYGAIRDAGPRALQALGMRDGLTHMEWFRRADGSIAISEVAARPPGAQFTTLLSYAHDMDFYRAWAEVGVFEHFEAPLRSYATGAAFLRGQGNGRVAELIGVDELQREIGDIVVEAKLPKIGQAKADSYEGEGYVILRHPDTRVVEQGLAAVVRRLKVSLE